MRRRMMGRRKVTYHLDCNYLADSGNLRVIVDDTCVGAVVDGICEWVSEPYKKDVIITIENAAKKTEESEYYTTGCVYRGRHDSVVRNAIYPDQTAYLPYDFCGYAYFVEILTRRTLIYTPTSVTLPVGIYDISINYENPTVTVTPMTETNGRIIHNIANHIISSIYPADSYVQQEKSYAIYFFYVKSGLSYSVTINNYHDYFHFHFAGS